MAAPGWDEALADIKKYRGKEAEAVGEAQTATAGAITAGQHIVTAGKWKSAGYWALVAWGRADGYCKGVMAGCLNILDAPVGQWYANPLAPQPGETPKGKRAKDRAWWYNEFARLEEIAAEKLGAPPPAPKPSPVVVKKGTGRPTSPADPEAVLADLVTGAEIDPNTGTPTKEEEEESFLETGIGRVGILAAGVALLYLVYRIYRGA